MNRITSFLIFKSKIGITLAPFGIYLKEKYLDDPRVINHEKIHWKQELEMLVIPFYIWYFVEWFIKVPVYGKHAYNAISMEREAHDNDHIPDYPETRKKFSWIKRVIK